MYLGGEPLWHQPQRWPLPRVRTLGARPLKNGTFRAVTGANATISDYGRAKKPRSDREPGEIDYGAETRQRGLSFNTVTRS
jgi:hypothetical protein